MIRPRLATARVEETLQEGVTQHVEEQMLAEECNGLPLAAMQYNAAAAEALGVVQRRN